MLVELWELFQKTRKPPFHIAERIILNAFKNSGVCVIGVDVGATFSVFAVDGQVHKVNHSELKTFKEELIKKADNRKIRIYFEQTGRYSLPIVETFLDVAELYLVEGKKLKAARELFSTPSKNDYYDARLLAIIGALPVPVIPLDYDAYTLRFLTQRKVRIEKTIQKSINRIRQCIAVLFPHEYENFTKNRLENPKNLSRLRELAENFTPFSAIQEELLIELTSEMQILELLLRQKQQVEERLELLSEKPSIKRDLEILMSFPGIGKSRALTLKASYIDIRRFPNWKAFIKFMGFTKQENQSGTSVNYKKKVNSNRLVRREMFMVCQLFKRDSVKNVAADYFRYYLLKTGGVFKKAFHKFSVKYLRVMYYCLKHGEKFTPELLEASLEDLISPLTREELRRNVKQLEEQRGKKKKKGRKR
ncbi:transposase [Phorcysia thermohydrogeniphila]|uniref:Transposase n=1 Tax=Phorcysia thermohydrogeniphila TaxID=936138 RepID=A0A4R1GDG6_9BACT|nr:transposase [Phorcysia thermohydrogeniphila]TCK06367.1 transposase [Phorcysia thermohydrogeniphila]